MRGKRAKILSKSWAKGLLIGLPGNIRSWRTVKRMWTRGQLQIKKDSPKLFIQT